METGDGPANMALDESLLESVAEGLSGAVLRTYGWIRPTLSLGYFQALALVEQEERWRGADLVRRPTGGGALWHHHEVTYALVIPKSHPLSRQTVDLYRAVHGAIIGLLGSSGIDARRRGDPDSIDPDRQKPFLCFADCDREDVISGRFKLVGSAQRRRAGAILLHGSILIRASPATPELPGVADLIPSTTDLRGWSRRILEAIPPSLGLEPVADEVSDHERGRADRLATEVYRNPAWTGKR